MFIPDFISLIKFNPSCVSCVAAFINLAILHQSIESSNLIPSNGFISKKGIIILVISEIFYIVKTTAAFPGYLYILPEPKYLAKSSINFYSLTDKDKIHFS